VTALTLIAVSVNEAWAAVIVALLNRGERNEAIEAVARGLNELKVGWK
jgi:hypothetical protein